MPSLVFKNQFTSPPSRECVGSRDPYCVWNTATKQCEVSTLSATGDEEGNVNVKWVTMLQE